MEMSRHQRLRAKRKAAGLCPRCGQLWKADDGPCSCRMPDVKPESIETAPRIVGCSFRDEKNAAGEVIAVRCQYCGDVQAVRTCPGCDLRITISRAGKVHHGPNCRAKAYRKRARERREAEKARAA